jgi:hypothetical protein
MRRISLVKLGLAKMKKHHFFPMSPRLGVRLFGEELGYADNLAKE